MLCRGAKEVVDSLQKVAMRSLFFEENFQLTDHMKLAKMIAQQPTRAGSHSRHVTLHQVSGREMRNLSAGREHTSAEPFSAWNVSFTSG